jgi:hypothetical protein
MALNPYADFSGRRTRFGKGNCTKDSSKCTLIYKYPTLDTWGLELIHFAIDTFNTILKV